MVPAAPAGRLGLLRIASSSASGMTSHKDLPTGITIIGALRMTAMAISWSSASSFTSSASLLEEAMSSSIPGGPLVTRGSVTCAVPRRWEGLTPSFSIFHRIASPLGTAAASFITAS